MRLVEDLNITDEFELIPPKTAMKKILKKLEGNPGLTFLIDDPKKGICGMIDQKLIQELEQKGHKIQRGSAQSNMLTNILEIIDKTPLERLPQLLPERRPDAVIVNSVAGDFVGFLSAGDFQEAVSALGGSNPAEPIQIDRDGDWVLESDDVNIEDLNFTEDIAQDKPPKPSRGPPPSRKKQAEEDNLPPEPEKPAIIVEEITEDDLEDETDAFFNRVKGRSKGRISNIHGEVADEAWGGAAEGTLETGSIMHPLGAGRAEGNSGDDGMTQVLMKTSAGEILLQMYDDKAPDTVANFMKLVDDGFYDGLHFHRVIEQFMLQGGCPLSRDPNNPRAGTGGPGWKISCEESALALSHNRPGLLSMANAGPNTGGSQFFLTTVECPWLDGNHAIFGEVVSGMDAVMAIEGCKKGAGDRPVRPQQIISVSRQE